MTGEIVIKCIQKQEHEGLSVQMNLNDVSLVDQFQIMTALAQGLKLPQPVVRIWCDMYCDGLLSAMYRKETVYDHSARASQPQQEERPQAFRDLDRMLSDLFGGNF